MEENLKVTEFSMRVKASYADKTMRWKAVNSDTDYDSYDERMSKELFKGFVEQVENKKPVPEEYKYLVESDYWKGGMPYLSISHYSDLNGKAVPGEPQELYVDGDKLKAKGVLYNTKLGKAVWKSLKSDEGKTDNKVRISIGFIDLAHRHGSGELWVRKDKYDLCPACSQGIGNKVYVNGYLVHLALTRVPVNTRTEMKLDALEEKSMKTRQEDAASIVGEEDAEEIEALAATVSKANVLVEMSEAEEGSTEAPSTEAPSTEALSDSDKEGEAVGKNIEEPVIENVTEPITEPITEPTAETTGEPVLKSGHEEAKAEVVKSSHPLQSVIDELLHSVDNSINLKSETERAELINPSMQKLGSSIMEYLSKFDHVPAVKNDEDNMLNDIKELIQPLADSLRSLTEEVGVMKAQLGAQGAEVKNRIPKPRTLPAQVVRSAIERPANKPLSTDEIARKSVGVYQSG